MLQEVPIVVAARVRPLLDQEKLHHEDQCVSFIDDKSQLILGKNRAFKFDHVFTPDYTQEQVYHNCVQPLVSCCFDGYNATVFAYGQTGSGKTYTMGTGNSAGLLENEFGVLPRAINVIFQTIKERSNKKLFKVKVSFIEIYKEEARDLLEFEGTGKDLHIREDDKGNTVVTGLREESVHCLEDITACLDSGASLRHTASTRVNEYSSRSHCIFSITIEQHPIAHQSPRENFNDAKDVSDVNDAVIISKFHFVDLAGSERVHRTGNQGERFRESISINSGLLALGNVISALSDTKRRMQHVPYRQSKLTRLLKDSLGGNSRTVMITCLSPCSTDLDENLNSLKYATRAKNIRNKPIINKIIESTRLAHMQNEIQVLKDELLRQRTMPVSSRDTGRLPENNKLKRTEEELERLRSQCESFKEIGHEAATLIRLFHDTDMPPYDVQDKLTQWIRSWNALLSVRQDPGPILFKKPQNGNMQQMQIELDKYKIELENDEEIFIEKSKELSEVKQRLKEMENERQQYETKLRKFIYSNRQKDKQLFEQQLKIQKLENQFIQQFKNSDGKENKVPRSAPGSKRDLSMQNEDKILLNIRARSEILISRLEDLDEVSRDTTFSSDEDNLDSDKDDLQTSEKRPGLGKTFTKEMPLFKQPERQDARRPTRARSALATNFTKPMETLARVSTTPSKLPVRKRSDAETDVIQTARRTTAETRRQVRDAEFNYNEARLKMRDLETNIIQKEEYIKELSANDKEKEQLNVQFKEKVRLLEREIDKSKKDLDESKKKLDNFEKQGTERQRLEKDYKRKLKNLETKVSLLEKKQNDSMVVSGLKEKGERKLNDLEGQVERLRNQHDNVSKKLKDETERKTKLEYELAKGEQKIKELELKTDQQQKLLKRKTEEVVAAHKKLRTVGNVSDKIERSDLEDKKKDLDLEIERILKDRREMEELEEELRKREAIIKRKEVLLNEKCEIEMKKLRSSQILNKDVLQLSIQLDDVEKAILDARSASTMMKDRATFQEDIAKLLRRKADLDKQRCNLENRLQEDDVLEPAEERRLAELIEAVDALEMAIEYKNEVIEAKESNLNMTYEARNEEIDNLLDQLGDLRKDESKALLRKYFEKVIDLKESERKTLDSKDEIEIELAEKERMILELHNCINQTEARAEKRLTEMDREYEKQIQFLMAKINEDEKNKISHENVKLLEKKVHDLEKDLYYHKKTSRELKHKLREVTGASVVSSVACNESVSSEKRPTSSRNSERRKGSFTSADNDDKAPQASNKTVSNEQHNTLRKPANELHLPPVKSDKKDALKSQKFDKHVAPDEQKRLKEIFEARQHSAKSRKDHKPVKSQPSDSNKSSASNYSTSSQEDQADVGKNPWN
eukprot:gene16705-18399_t